MATTVDLTFTEVRADDEAGLRSWFELVRAVHAADRPDDPPPSWPMVAGQLRHQMPDTRTTVVLAHDGDDLVGWCGQWLPLAENRDTSPGEIEVHPDHRRRGHGTALLDEWRRRAQQSGRSRLVTGAAEGIGDAFVTAAGFRAVLPDTQRRLHLAALSEPGLAALLADARAHSAGYSLVRWTGGAPDRYAAGVAALESRMTTDPPLDDLRWEQEVFDVERLRAHDAVQAARGNRRYTTAAVHDLTGDVVGYTAIVMSDGVDGAAEQWQTIVLPAHRGHRLGMLLKLENLDHLRAHEPAVRTIDTWNAASNAPMLRVNLAMGFEVVREWAEYERDV